MSVLTRRNRVTDIRIGSDTRVYFVVESIYFSRLYRTGLNRKGLYVWRTGKGRGWVKLASDKVFTLEHKLTILWRHTIRRFFNNDQ